MDHAHEAQPDSGPDEIGCGPTAGTQSAFISRLPIEVMRNIVSFLQRDTATLISCMRVSPDFNAVSAPYLYQTSVMSETSNPFYHPNTISESQTRMTMPKHRHFRHVKHAIIKEHGEGAHIGEDIDSREEVEEEPILPIETIRYEPGYMTDHRHLDVCKFSRRVSSKKLVLSYQSEPHSIAMREHWRPDSIVMISHDPARTIEHGQAFFPGLVKPRQAIYILYTPNPATLFAPIANVSATPRSSGQNSWVSRYAIVIARMAIQKNHPDNILIVNAGQIDPENLQGHEPGSRSSEAVQRSLQTKVQSFVTTGGDYFVNQGLDMTGDYGCQASRVELKNMDELGKIKIDYMSFPDYLRQHDWTDEFSNEEVKGWLLSRENHDGGRGEDKGRARSGREELSPGGKAARQ